MESAGGCCIGRVNARETSRVPNAFQGVLRAMEWLGVIVRFVVAALALMLVGAIVPGFSQLSFVNALVAAVVIAALGWVIEAILGRRVSPYGRGIVGFLVSAVVIWAAQFVVPGLQVTVLGALLAAFIIGVIDLFVPTAIR